MRGDKGLSVMHDSDFLSGLQSTIMILNVEVRDFRRGHQNVIVGCKSLIGVGVKLRDFRRGHQNVIVGAKPLL